MMLSSSMEVIRSKSAARLKLFPGNNWIDVYRDTLTSSDALKISGMVAIF
ncbi:MAG: hypothetical protein GY786_19950 [Proteobacteria bacterium]|nr:hypothetical protein [Pseudomonadota bacterium]